MEKLNEILKLYKNETIPLKNTNHEKLSWLKWKILGFYYNLVDPVSFKDEDKIQEYLLNIPDANLSEIFKMVFPKHKIDLKEFRINEYYLAEFFEKVKDDYKGSGSSKQFVLSLKKKLSKKAKRTLSEYLANHKNVEIDEEDLKMFEIFKSNELSMVECDILTTKIGYYKYSFFEDAIDNVKDYSYKSSSEIFSLVNRYYHVLSHPKLQIQNALKPESSLLRRGLLDEYGKVNDCVVAYVNGLSEGEFHEMYFIKDKKKSIDLKKTFLDAKTIKFVQNLLKSNEGCDILFYGPPGVGKTEVARSLIHSVKKTSHLLNGTFIGSGDLDINVHRMKGIVLAENILVPKSDVLVIDEADSVLNLWLDSKASNKSRLNDMLTNKKTIRIWITNATWMMDKSTKRRFDYSIKFENYKPIQRELIWNNILEEKPHLQSVMSSELITEFSNRYEVNAGGIHIALNNVKNESNPTKVKSIIEETLSSHCKLLNHKVDNSYQKVSEKYSLKGLNIKGFNPQVLPTLEKFNSYWKSHQSDISGMDVKNMNVLTYGPPGTGKTEFVKYLSKKLNRKLIVKKASDLKSKWVGGTEENIAAMFAEGREDNAILFLDEADSMLMDRNSTEANHEISSINEFLTQMENYPGIFICATNYKDNLDVASLRRFNFKLEFNSLNGEGALCFYKKFFKVKEGYVSLKKNQSEKLLKINGLVPGDFKIVWQRNAFLSPRPDGAYIVEALLEELAQRQPVKRPIGFAR